MPLPHLSSPQSVKNTIYVDPTSPAEGQGFAQSLAQKSQAAHVNFSTQIPPWSTGAEYFAQIEKNHIFAERNAEFFEANQIEKLRTFVPNPLLKTLSGFSDEQVVIAGENGIFDSQKSTMERLSVDEILKTRDDNGERLSESVDVEQWNSDYQSARFDDLYATALANDAQVVTQGRVIAQLQGQSAQDLKLYKKNRINDRAKINEGWWQHDYSTRQTPSADTFQKNQDIVAYINDQQGIIAEQRATIHNAISQINSTPQENRKILQGVIYKGSNSGHGRPVTPDTYRNATFHDADKNFYDLRVKPDADAHEPLYNRLVDGRTALSLSGAREKQRLE